MAAATLAFEAPPMFKAPSSLTLAVIVSLVLHVVLLIWGPHINTSPEAARAPLVATLRPLPAEVPAPVAQPIEKSKPAPVVPPAPKPVVKQKTPPRVAKPEPLPAPRSPAPPVAQAEPAPAAEAPVAQPAAPQLESAARNADAGSASTTAALDAAQGARRGEAAVDPGSIAQYQLALNIAAKKYRTYPRYARQREWEGRVTVRLEFGADGKVAGIRVKKPSGYEILDKSAYEMLRKAQLDTPVPESLRGRAFAVEVAVVYELKE